MDLTASLTQKREATLQRLRDLEQQHRQIAVDIERHVGRIATLNELLQELEAPSEEPAD